MFMTLGLLFCFNVLRKVPQPPGGGLLSNSPGDQLRVLKRQQCLSASKTSVVRQITTFDRISLSYFSLVTGSRVFASAAESFIPRIQQMIKRVRRASCDKIRTRSALLSISFSENITFYIYVHVMNSAQGCVRHRENRGRDTLCLAKRKIYTYFCVCDCIIRALTS
jgi:translation initiation factor 2B subunit (eIF-2B alpha/beta/delta family)